MYLPRQRVQSGNQRSDRDRAITVKANHCQCSPQRRSCRWTGDGHGAHYYEGGRRIFHWGDIAEYSPVTPRGAKLCGWKSDRKDRDYQ
jgi:hypothetical protein